jgi:hypothetical protein
MELINKGQKATIIEQRFKELQKDGKNQQEIFEQMIKEGL